MIDYKQAKNWMKSKTGELVIEYKDNFYEVILDENNKIIYKPYSMLPLFIDSILGKRTYDYLSRERFEEYLKEKRNILLNEKVYENLFETQLDVKNYYKIEELNKIALDLDFKGNYYEVYFDEESNILSFDEWLLNDEIMEKAEKITKEEFFLLLAEKLSKHAHKGQKDKAGKDYFSGHIVGVVSGVNSIDEKTVAYLHDVVEDTIYTEKHIRGYFPKHIADAVMLLTKKDEEYFDYIERIKNNLLAKKVKISDLKHNSDLTRISSPTKKDIERTEKYQKAISILNDEKYDSEDLFPKLFSNKKNTFYVEIDSNNPISKPKKRDTFYYEKPIGPEMLKDKPLDNLTDNNLDIDEKQKIVDFDTKEIAKLNEQVGIPQEETSTIKKDEKEVDIQNKQSINKKENNMNNYQKLAKLIEDKNLKVTQFDEKFVVLNEEDKEIASLGNFDTEEVVLSAIESIEKHFAFIALDSVEALKAYLIK